MRHLALVLICLVLALAPWGLISLMSLGAPSSEHLVPYFAFSLGAALLGLAVSVREWLRRRVLVPVLAIVALAVPVGLSSLGLKDGIAAQMRTDDSVFCAAARRDGTAPIPKTDPRYKPRLDSDTDGQACERAPNNPYASGTE